MNKSLSRLAILLPLVALLVVSACSDNGDDIMGSEDFEAALQDFTNYGSWEQIDYEIYPTNFNTLGGAAHAANDSTFVRQVYISPGAQISDGEYDQETIVVKETFQWDNGEKDFTNGNLLAMVKRGGDFNSDHNGWEWFNIAPDLSVINDRGADMMNGACNDCHAATETDETLGDDYVFNHPSEFVVEDGDEYDFFADGPDNWEQIDSTYGLDARLQGFAHGDTMYSRITYRWQPGGKFDEDYGEYPVGTTIIKEVFNWDNGNKVYPPDGGWTAMVKRGGDYNSSGGDWEWFMFNPVDSSLSDRGQLAGCIDCHAGAANDYVFDHPGL
ncbi:MAG: hypothetical protein GF315_11085 [candidate division Zixibacteria bacterium]|nr:hypothetical protein [candidate division Zixibacteria bacterium]